MDISKDIVALGALSLRFARTNRATFHEDGTTPESDTDHTVMLGLCACAIAHSYAPHLDIGKIAQFAFVHDLVEAYAGDTPSLGISANAKKKKDEIEALALLRIEKEFNESFPWIVKTIHEYESLETEEVKFIKTLDKIMPKITQILNKGKQFAGTDFTHEILRDMHARQIDELANSYGKNHPILMKNLEILMYQADETLRK